MEKQGGYFLLDDELEIKNTLVSAGASLFLRDMFRAEAVLASTLYLGVTNATYDFDTTTLADIAVGEPVGNGYARQALNRNTTDWVVREVNRVMQAASKRCIFTATSDWDKTWQRVFLCDAASGTSGVLYAVSGPAPAPRTVRAGMGPPIAYQFWLRG